MPWQRLHHAYGPAADVPERLRALLSPDPARRGEARRHLWASICHQGTRWQASQAAVPFLVALVDDPATPDRAGVLALLTAVAIGPRRDDRLPFDADRAFAPADALDGVDLTETLGRFYSGDELTGEETALLELAVVRWEADCHRCAARFTPAMTGWVSDPEQDVAALAAALLPWFPPTPAGVAALAAVPAERERARASANLALAHSPGADPAADRRLRDLLGSGGDLVPVTAAVALAYRHGDALPEQALSVLVDASARDLPAEVTGWDRAPRGFVMLALRRLGLG
ncbi:hypothetical protein [Catellatospora sp. TT07R-123]|uniref:hypothetical protein n=1 Tax=Catellatospora sp. TT07R-123 TaxID=2733863 RepID=UPI001BB2F498|nr:hypothetical protein [Catellatospora sp. TT07R-123]